MRPSQKCVSTARAAVACHPFLGWLGSSASKMSGTSTAPAANCSQLGGTKPASSRVCTLDTTPVKLGEACCSSTARRIVVDTSGWRSLIILMESAQLAQCAACRKRTLLRMPRPPSVKGNVATALADSETASTAICKKGWQGTQKSASHVSERTGVRTRGRQIEHRSWPWTPHNTRGATTRTADLSPEGFSGGTLPDK